MEQKNNNEQQPIANSSADIEGNPMLYAVFSEHFDKWQKEYNPSNYFIDGGRTIPYDFHFFCSNMWGVMKHQRGSMFEMFRDEMLTVATNWKNSCKSSLWDVVRNFSGNSLQL